MTAFALGLAAMPLATAAIGAVYLLQYRLARTPRWVAVGVHFVSVSTIICTYAVLCYEYYRDSPWQYAGWAVFGAGSVLFWYAVRCHPTCLVPDERVGVVHAGPYRYIRHPIYSGGLLGALGLIGVAPAWQLAGVWLSLAVSLLVLACLEERELAARFGSPYREYARATRLLIPGVL